MESDVFFDKVIKYCETSHPTMIGYKDMESQVTLFGLANTPGLVAFIPEDLTPGDEQAFESTTAKIKTLFETYINQLYETPVRNGVLYLSLVSYGSTDFSKVDDTDEQCLEFLTYLTSIMEKCEEVTDPLIYAQEEFEEMDPTDPHVTWQ